MEQQSIVNILRKVNKISNLDKTTIVQEIQKRFEMAMQKEDETEHKAMSTAYQGWEQNGYEIDHSFELELPHLETIAQAFVKKHCYILLLSMVIKM